GSETVAGGVAASLIVTLPTPVWATALTAIDRSTADVLLRVCRVLYPHDDLSDDYYAACVEGLDAKAAKDNELAKLLKSGVSKLDSVTAGKFLALHEADQVEVLTKLEDTPFFQTVRGYMVVALYNDHRVWSHFGYEGPSFPFGGYLERGFNDIDWLPKA
ncbi:MAG: hypothetical protein VCB07_03470, partial [Gammaproteobacteria bacterium]